MQTPSSSEHFLSSINQILETTINDIKSITLTFNLPKPESLESKIAKQSQIIRNLAKENLNLKETLQTIPKQATDFDFQILKTRILDMHKHSLQKQGDLDRFLKDLGKNKIKDFNGVGLTENRKIEELHTKLIEKEKIISAFRSKMKTLVGLGYEKLGKTALF